MPDFVEGEVTSKGTAWVRSRLVRLASALALALTHRLADGDISLRKLLRSLHG